MVRVVPLLSTDLITRGLTARNRVTGIRSLAGFGKLVCPLVQSVLYPLYTILTLYLNIFRRERDITEFDWPFTPIHSSSKNFSAFTGSVLHEVLPSLQPGHE